MRTSASLKTDFVRQNRDIVVDRVRAAQASTHARRVLVDLGLSLAELNSALSGPGDENVAPLFPHSFFSTLRKGVSPHIRQVAALSTMTGFLFIDWLSLFGFDLREITRLQVKLHTDRTALIMPKERMLPRKLSRSSEDVPGAITPGSACQPRSLLFAKVGLGDGMAFPEIMPGSIVSVDTSKTAVFPSGSTRTLYLVEHLRGLSCCYVNRVSEHEILLTPHYLPYPCLRYRLGEQAVILGAIESELRPLKDVMVPDPSRANWIERHCPIRSSRGPTLSQLLRNSRERIGLRFREARAITESVALEMGSEEYAIALGSLSDYEASDALPRHITKIMSLCIAYGIDLNEYLSAAGISMCEDAKTALPMNAPAEGSSLAVVTPGDNSSLRCWSESWYRFPLSLLQAFKDTLPNRSALQWMECSTGSALGQGQSVPSILLVDKSSTRFERATWPAMWQRPVYLVRHRNGRLIYGFCTITDGLLIVHEDPASNARVESFSRYDVEVVGRVVAALRGIGR